MYLSLKSLLPTNLTFFFRLLMVSSLGRLGDLLGSWLSDGAFFSNSDFPVTLSTSALKDLGWFPVSEFKRFTISVRQQSQMGVATNVTAQFA